MAYKPIIALTRGLEVLRIVNQQKEASVGSIHAVSKLDKATIVRMLRTLEVSGYVARRSNGPSYYVTAHALALSRGYEHRQWVSEIAEPIISKVRTKVEWPLQVALFDYDAMIIEETVFERGSAFMVRHRPGYRLSMFTTAVGRAYLAFCSAEERDQIVSRQAKVPDAPNELARQPEKLSAILNEIQAKGYALTPREFIDEAFGGKIWGISVPIAVGEAVFGCLYMMMLLSAVPEEAGLEQFLPILTQTADEIGLHLSGTAMRQISDRKRADSEVNRPRIPK